MNLSQLFILRPVMTTLLMVATLVIGIMAYFNIPVSNLPDVNYPVITVTTPFPGANPDIMANTVATPLEKQFMTIPGIKYVTSSNTLGVSSIILEFDIDKDIDLAAVDVNAAIVAAKPFLPPNLPQDPTFKKVNPSSTPIIYLSVTSPTMTLGKLYDYANTYIGQRISILNGVSQVTVYGSPFAVRAQIDPGLVASLNLSQSEIAGAIGQGNQYLPLGQFDGAHTASVIYDNGGLLNAQEYDPLIVAYRNGSPVRLQDLGDVVNSLQNDRAFRRFLNKEIDQPSVTVAVQRQAGANAVQVSDAVRHLLDELKGGLPASVDLIVVFDRAESIKNSVKDVELTLLVAFILVILVIFVYLGSFRDTLIPSLAMPMSIIATIAVIYSIGYTLDSLSLLALTLAIGFIIDDAIVVLENIVRRIEGGEKPFEASIEGSKQVSFTIVSMTLSLVAVFIPLIFMAGLIGKLFREFANTLTIVTIASGIVSLILTPMLCSKFLSSDTGEKGKLSSFSKRLNKWMLGLYKQALILNLKHRWFVLLAGALSILLSVYFFYTLPSDFIPDEDIGFIIGFTEAEQGTSSDQMRAYQQQVVDILRQNPNIQSIISNSATPEFRQGIVFIKMIPRNQRNAIDKIILELHSKLAKIPGINVFLKNVPLIDLNVGPQVRGAYQYLIQSLDSDQLYRSASVLIEKMRDDPMFQGISTDLEIKTPQLNLELQRDVASTLGIDAKNFESAFLYGFSGNRISRIQTPIDQYDVILEINRNLQRNPLSLDLMYLRSSTTQQLVPLSAIATWKEGVGPASINHFAQFPAVTITFNLSPGVALSDGLSRLDALARGSFSPQVTGSVKGAAEAFKETMNSVGFLFLLTIFIIYIILGMLYESYIHPLTILSTLPPAIVGGLLALFLTSRPLSLYAYLGLVLLIGIVKKNGIMMVDFALDNIRTKGESAETSIFEACLVRFRPIMMTTITAIMGALPIAIGIGAGAESRRPLGYVIIGGLIISQLVTLFLTPVIYLYFENLREWFMKKT
jgi:HAE1 family hydrophobic/amphiphilic exporter-1